MPIDIRASYRVLFDSDGDHSLGEGTFTVPIPDSAPACVVRAGAKNALLVEAPDLMVSDQLISWLEKGQQTTVTDWPKDLEEEIEKLHDQLISAARRPTAMLKYFLGFSNISDDLVTLGGVEWAVAKEVWHPFPFKATMTGTMISQLPLSVPLTAMVQDDLNNDVRPFLAMRHLHRALKEAIPRFKWIEATIAAELAIKEALIIAKPDLAILLP